MMLSLLKPVIWKMTGSLMKKKSMYKLSKINMSRKLRCIPAL